MKLTFTEKAKQKVQSFIEAGQGKHTVLRMLIASRSVSGFGYQFFLEGESDKRDADVELDLGPFRVRMDSSFEKDLENSSVDWVEDMSGSGFKVENPNPAMPHLQGSLAEKIHQVLESEINPSLAAHGGSAELVDLQEGGKLYLKMSGGCQGCGQASATLRQGIEVRLRELFPEIKEVIDVTDHAGGQNPYYAY